MPRLAHDYIITSLPAPTRLTRLLAGQDHIDPRRALSGVRGRVFGGLRDLGDSLDLLFGARDVVG